MSRGEGRPYPIPHIPEPHPPAPHPNDPPAGSETVNAPPGPEFARAAAGTLNCLTRVVPLHRGHRGTSPGPRTRVSKACSWGRRLARFSTYPGVLSPLRETSGETFSIRPPPNRTCNFHCIRLSSNREV